MKDEIIKLIEKKEVISFDIFDTLIFRNISRPTDIFRTMNSEIELQFDIKNFSELRIEAEINSRKYSQNGEVTIDDIYNELSKFIKNKNHLDRIKLLELERELEFLVENPFMKQIYLYCISKQKKVFFISDMYLGSTFIKKVLNKCGYDVKNNLYVSCECNSIKGDGSLFQYVKEKNNLDYSSWLHIGDNIEADNNQPQKLGITTYYYKNINSYCENNSKSVFESIILGMKNNIIYCGIDNSYWQNFGYNYLVPIYIGFTNWLYMMTYNSDNLFFLARDGYILKKIYELFPQNDKYIDYLYVSRNSLQIPVMFKNSKDMLLDYFTSNNNTKLKDFFTKGQLELKEEYLNIIKLYGFNSFDDIVDEKNLYSARKCVAACWPDVYDEVNNNYLLAQKYLIQEKVNSFALPNVVDVGWGGSIQDSMRTILNKDLNGYYFGTIPANKSDYISHSFGYMFDQNNPTEIKERIFDQVMMYELIFSAPHGSTIEYCEKNGKVTPVLKEKDNYSDYLEEFQQASLDLIKEIMHYYKYYDSLDKEFCLSFYDKFLYQRNYVDIVEFKKLETDYELGNEKKFPFVRTIKSTDLNNPKKYDELLKEINLSLWHGSYIIDGIQNNDERVNLSYKFEKYRFEIENLMYLDKYYENYDQYVKIIEDKGNKDYLKYLLPLADKYYKKHRQTIIRKIRRKIIPYRLRNKIKNFFKKNKEC